MAWASLGSIFPLSVTIKKVPKHSELFLFSLHSGLLEGLLAPWEPFGFI